VQHGFMSNTDPAERPAIIACVDDDASVLEALEGLLKAFGYQVLAFTSAEALLEIHDLGSISCVITDIRLGSKSGLQLQKDLVAMGHAIPTIIITAFAEAGYRESAMKAGAVDFLSKPISPERLMQAVRGALGGVRP